MVNEKPSLCLLDTKNMRIFCEISFLLIEILILVLSYRFCKVRVV